MNEQGQPFGHDNKNYFPATETLQRKAGVLVQTLDTSMWEGQLDPRLVRSFQSGAARTHQDLLLVYLGLKPAASLLTVEVYGRNESFYRDNYSIHDYMLRFPLAAQGGSDLRVVYAEEFTGDILAVWNPGTVTLAIRRNPDVFRSVTISPEDSSFGYLFYSFARHPTGPFEDRIYGLLVGIPRDDVERFAAYDEPLYELCSDLETLAQREGLVLFNQNSLLTPPAQVGYNADGVRDRVVTFVEQRGIEVDPKLMNYIRQIRPAEVPGFRYVTTGPLSDHERQLTQAWESSQIDQKLEALLASHGV